MGGDLCKFLIYMINKKYVKTPKFILFIMIIRRQNLLIMAIFYE